MLRNAWASDVGLVAITPHCAGPYGSGNFLDHGLQSRFDQLKAAAKDISVELVLGAEARVDEHLPEHLAQGKIPTINKSRYLLTEFDDRTKPQDFLPMLKRLMDMGYVPLVAHPERYAAVWQTPQIVQQWLELGCHLQLTGGSVLGNYGKTVQHTAAWLLKNDLVACVASDAHSTDRRSNFLMGVYDHLSVQYSKRYAACLLYEIPKAICANDEI